MFPHEMPRAQEFGRSPGNGLTPMAISRDPIATEGEATPGPDDWNPYDERERRREMEPMQLDEDPTDGRDPFVFDDVGGEIDEVELPALRGDPELRF